VENSLSGKAFLIYTYDEDHWQHKELMDVFTVIGNNPVPSIHLWSDEPDEEIQIV
jgi:hypothetical protein